MAEFETPVLAPRPWVKPENIQVPAHLGPAATMNKYVMGRGERVNDGEMEEKPSGLCAVERGRAGDRTVVRNRLI